MTTASTDVPVIKIAFASLSCKWSTTIPSQVKTSLASAYGGTGAVVISSGSQVAVWLKYSTRNNKESDGRINRSSPKTVECE